jgi:hypothetical protein
MFWSSARALRFMKASVAVILALTTSLFGQSPRQKHPFTFEDMMKLKRVGAPVPSPDGKWVLFSGAADRLPACLGHRSILLADLLRKQAGSLSGEVRAGLANGKIPDFPRQPAIAQTFSASLVSVVDLV